MAAMLPWRRSKFVLAEEQGPTRKKDHGKSLGPGLSYGSLLYSLVHSCPDLWPEWPLERLGSVFRSKRQKVELNKEDPTYTVRYLGNAVTLQAKGEGCTDEAVDRIWAKSEFGARSTKMKLTLGPQGIRMSPGERGTRRPSHAYLLHRITYCAADRRHPKVFVWVYRHQVKNKAVVLRCHAVLLSKAEKAGAMALLLCQTSHSAFNEFKRLKRQNDSRHLQQQLLGEAIIPLVPLRKLLNSKCPYRPPLERNRSTPKLSAIQEEEEEEKEEEKGEGGKGKDTAPRDPACGQAHHIPGIRATIPLCASPVSTTFPISTLAGSSTDSTTRGVHSTSTAHIPRIRASLPLCTSNVAPSLHTGTLAISTADSANSSGPLAAVCRGSKTAKGWERPEVLTLTRELKVCTLRSPQPQPEGPSWELPQEPSCLSC